MREMVTQQMRQKFDVPDTTSTVAGLKIFKLITCVAIGQLLNGPTLWHISLKIYTIPCQVWPANAPKISGCGII